MFDIASVSSSAASHRESSRDGSSCTGSSFLDAAAGGGGGNAGASGSGGGKMQATMLDTLYRDTFGAAAPLVEGLTTLSASVATTTWPRVLVAVAIIMEVLQWLALVMNPYVPYPHATLALLVYVGGLWPWWDQNALLAAAATYDPTTAYTDAYLPIFWVATAAVLGLCGLLAASVAQPLWTAQHILRRGGRHFWAACLGPLLLPILLTLLATIPCEPSRQPVPSAAPPFSALAFVSSRIPTASTTSSSRPAASSAPALPHLLSRAEVLRSVAAAAAFADADRRLFFFPSVLCSDATVDAHRIVAAVMLALLSVVAVLHALASPVPRAIPVERSQGLALVQLSIFAIGNSVARTASLLLRVAAAFCFALIVPLGLPGLHLFLTGLAALVLLGVHAFTIPFYRPTAQRVLGAAYAVVAFVALLGALLTLPHVVSVTEGRVFEDQGGHGLVLGFGAAVAAVAGSWLSVVRVSRRTLALIGSVAQAGFVPHDQNPFVAACLARNPDLLPYPRGLPACDYLLSPYRGLEMEVTEEAIAHEVSARDGTQPGGMEVPAAPTPPGGETGTGGTTTTRMLPTRVPSTPSATAQLFGLSSPPPPPHSHPTSGAASGSGGGSTNSDSPSTRLSETMVRFALRAQVTSPYVEANWSPLDAEVAARVLYLWVHQTGCAPTPHMMHFVCRMFTKFLLAYPHSVTVAVAYARFLVAFAPSPQRLATCRALLADARRWAWTLGDVAALHSAAHDVERMGGSEDRRNQQLLRVACDEHTEAASLVACGWRAVQEGMPPVVLCQLALRLSQATREAADGYLRVLDISDGGDGRCMAALAHLCDDVLVHEGCVRLCEGAVRGTTYGALVSRTNPGGVPFSVNATRASTSTDPAAADASTPPTGAITTSASSTNIEHSGADTSTARRLSYLGAVAAVRGRLLELWPRRWFQDIDSIGATAALSALVLFAVLITTAAVVLSQVVALRQTSPLLEYAAAIRAASQEVPEAVRALVAVLPRTAQASALEAAAAAAAIAAAAQASSSASLSDALATGTTTTSTASTASTASLAFNGSPVVLAAVKRLAAAKDALMAQVAAATGALGALQQPRWTMAFRDPVGAIFDGAQVTSVNILEAGTLIAASVESLVADLQARTPLITRAEALEHANARFLTTVVPSSVSTSLDRGMQRILRLSSAAAYEGILGLIACATAAAVAILIAFVLVRRALFIDAAGTAVVLRLFGTLPREASRRVAADARLRALSSSDWLAAAVKRRAALVLPAANKPTSDPASIANTGGAVAGAGPPHNDVAPAPAQANGLRDVRDTQVSVSGSGDEPATGTTDLSTSSGHAGTYTSKLLAALLKSQSKRDERLAQSCRDAGAVGGLAEGTGGGGDGAATATGPSVTGNRSPKDGQRKRPTGVTFAPSPDASQQLNPSPRHAVLSPGGDRDVDCSRDDGPDDGEQCEDVTSDDVTVAMGLEPSGLDEVGGGGPDGGSPMGVRVLQSPMLWVVAAVVGAAVAFGAGARIFAISGGLLADRSDALRDALCVADIEQTAVERMLRAGDFAAGGGTYSAYIEALHAQNRHRDTSRCLEQSTLLFQRPHWAAHTAVVEEGRRVDVHVQAAVLARVLAANFTAVQAADGLGARFALPPTMRLLDQQRFRRLGVRVDAIARGYPFGPSDAFLRDPARTPAALAQIAAASVTGPLFEADWAALTAAYRAHREQFVAAFRDRAALVVAHDRTVLALGIVGGVVVVVSTVALLATSLNVRRGCGTVALTVAAAVAGALCVLGAVVALSALHALSHADTTIIAVMDGPLPSAAAEEALVRHSRGFVALADRPDPIHLSDALANLLNFLGVRHLGPGLDPGLDPGLASLGEHPVPVKGIIFDSDSKQNALHRLQDRVASTVLVGVALAASVVDPHSSGASSAAVVANATSTVAPPWPLSATSEGRAVGVALQEHGIGALLRGLRWDHRREPTYVADRMVLAEGGGDVPFYTAKASDMAQGPDARLARARGILRSPVVTDMLGALIRAASTASQALTSGPTDAIAQAVATRALGMALLFASSVIVCATGIGVALVVAARLPRWAPNSAEEAIFDGFHARALPRLYRGAAATALIFATVFALAFYLELNALSVHRFIARGGRLRWQLAAASHAGAALAGSVADGADATVAGDTAAWRRTLLQIMGDIPRTEHNLFFGTDTPAALRQSLEVSAVFGPADRDDLRPLNTRLVSLNGKARRTTVAEALAAQTSAASAVLPMKSSTSAEGFADDASGPSCFAPERVASSAASSYVAVAGALRFALVPFADGDIDVTGSWEADKGVARRAQAVDALRAAAAALALLQLPFADLVAGSAVKWLTTAETALWVLVAASTVVVVATTLFVLRPIATDTADVSAGLRVLLASTQRRREETGDIVAFFAGVNAGASARDTQLKQRLLQSERLLLNILPPVISRRLQAGEGLIADQHPSVTATFAALVGFDAYSSHMSARSIVLVLNRLVVVWDRIVDRIGLEKIKMIGDIYFLCGGLTKRTIHDHPVRSIECALLLEEALAEHNTLHRMPGLQLRTGINTDAAVAGVIGSRKVAYDLWGDCVNTASRMQSTGIAGKIQVSERTHRLVRAHYLFEERTITAKGKGELRTYIYAGRAGPRPIPPVNWREVDEL